MSHSCRSSTSTIVARKSSQPAFRSGDTLPGIAVRDMNGRSQILAKNLQRQTRFVVVDPTCGSCEQMINELKQLVAATGVPRPSCNASSRSSIASAQAPAHGSVVCGANPFSAISERALSSRCE